MVKIITHTCRVNTHTHTQVHNQQKGKKCFWAKVALKVLEKIVEVI